MVWGVLWAGIGAQFYSHQAQAEDRSIASAEAEESAPTPEPPYPGSENGGFAADRSMSPATAPKPAPQPKQAGMQKFPEEPKPAPPSEVERPKRIDEEGNYIYDSTPKAPGHQVHEGVIAPTASGTDDSFFYKTDEVKAKFSGNPDIEAPVGINSNGEYRYKMETHVSNRSASFRFGVITPPNITNAVNGVTFSSMYGGGPTPLLIGNYEFYHKQLPIGRIGLNFTSGLMAANAPGHFLEGDASRGGAIPDEHFTFLMLPNTLAANFQFKYSEKQTFVPFIEGGPGYFTFVEVRDDFQRTKGGGSPALVGAGGFNILLDNFDPHSLHELDAQYGINHLWLSMEFRMILGLESDVNLTAGSFNVGFILEY